MFNNKRFFTFGCSFTHFVWPTWADLIGYNFGENYYNYGQLGAGNIFIFNSIVEANQVHKFTKDDLIIIQWSSLDREDRYIDCNWVTPGCLINYQTSDYIKKYYSKRGFLIRDLALITSITYMLKAIGCQYKFLTLNSINPIRNYSENSDSDTADDVVDRYQNIFDLMPESFDEVLGPYESRRPFNIDNIVLKDNHPIPTEHYKYLQKVIPEYAIECIGRAQEYDQQLFELIKNYGEKWYYELSRTYKHWPIINSNFMRINQIKKL